MSSCQYGTVQPPCLNPPSVSSSAPPGAWITPSRVMNSATISSLMSVPPPSRRRLLDSLARFRACALDDDRLLPQNCANLARTVRAEGLFARQVGHGYGDVGPRGQASRRGRRIRRDQTGKELSRVPVLGHERGHSHVEKCGLGVGVAGQAFGGNDEAVERAVVPAIGRDIRRLCGLNRAEVLQDKLLILRNLALMRCATDSREASQEKGIHCGDLSSHYPSFGLPSSGFG